MQSVLSSIPPARDSATREVIGQSLVLSDQICSMRSLWGGGNDSQLQEAPAV
jgi:hypothetical protein